MADRDVVADDAGNALGAVEGDMEDAAILDVGAPIRTGASSPRMTTLNQILACAPISTSPVITTPGAIKAVGSMRGRMLR
jgi:hypothetical protein